MHTYQAEIDKSIFNEFSTPETLGSLHTKSVARALLGLFGKMREGSMDAKFPAKVILEGDVSGARQEHSNSQVLA